MERWRTSGGREDEQGFMLVGAIVLVFLVLLTLSVAAPKVAKELRREREVEAIHRGNEYVRAIQLYYRKFGHYPGNMEQLEKANNVRFLRQKYEDPMTGKPDWRLIHIGEAKTTVKGFFGQPLAGLPGSTGGLGSAASMVSAQPTTTVNGTSGASSPTSTMGSTSGGLGSTSSSPASSSPFSSSPGSSPGGTSSAPGSTVSSGSSSSSFGGGIGSQSATTFTGGGAPIVGVGSSKTGESISVLNEQTSYETWEFLYDPRIEQMKAKAALLGGAAPTSGGPGGFGTGTTPTQMPGTSTPMSPTPTPSQPR